MVLRVAVIGDSHFDQHKRFEECQRLHAWIREDAERRGCTLTLHGGDLFERKSTPLERAAAFGWLRDMADLGQVVIVRGNHDAVDDLPLAAKLDTANPITVVETAAVVEVNGALIACMAWPRKSELLAATGVEGRADAEEIAAEALRDVLRGLGDELAEHDGPTMLLMHAMVRDSKTGTGQPLVGCDFEVTLADLALVRCHAYFLAHVHMFQDWLIGNAPVIYPGDPRRTDFGEGRDRKGYVVGEWDDAGAFVGWEFVEVPATPMVDLCGEWTTDGLVGIAVDGDGDYSHVKGAEVRLRYTTPSDYQQAARRSAEELSRILIGEGAVLVKIEGRVIVEQRARADVIAPNASLVEQLEAYWKSKGFEPGERKPALLAKLGRVLEARRAA